jgi:hypothetical protein
MSAALQLVPTRLTNGEIAAMVSALDSIWLLTNFMILSKKENPSQQLLEKAISRINQTCESLEPIMQKFEE